MKKVFVCDDNDGILDVSTIVLEGAGYDVVTAKNGEELRENIKCILPDLILMDLWMPGDGGDVLTQEIKENDYTKHIPVIVFSACRNIESAAEKAGADGYLKKPFDIQALKSVVKKYTTA